MIIDLHVHTSPLSSCSKLDPEEAIRQAKSTGLDGICFTEHGRLWPDGELEFLRRKYSFPVFCGMEVETKDGHVLAFGLPEDQPAVMDTAELRQKVDGAGGVLVYAHPFRGFLLFGFSDLQLTVQTACQRQIFQLVQAIETYSGKSTRNENEMALAASQKTGLPGTGGSDAHAAREVGRCATFFEDDIRDREGLIAALKSGRFRSDYFHR
ncbi:PHP domain-containing protein [Desulfotomaculum copahuensis]|uniref:Polymerase/histidinol phosphatase N-terminal domain-containing protein n=1 Tax=Desulfotomaculum copahuensis TaxID=1838280 RepID=A0A1B7LDY5_9FIRM|nr:PHP domain-containing protein [Desulfotomaculum copahuensis]OAT81307.1 hypothetical protein A6M21_00480 [Desulfotomaculum copahuensis]